MEHVYSKEDIRRTYEPIRDHIRTKHIIVQYALNRLDIRDVALHNLDLSGVKRVLDIGCGYGFFTEKLKERLHPAARIVGIDVIDRHNRDAFLQTLDSIGYQGDFIHAQADFIKDIPDSSFDLVIASYSLYFFPHLIGEIARILSPEGVFLTVTHSKHSLKEVTRYVPRCMKMVGIDPPVEIAINRLFQSFSLEDGEAKLTPHFGCIERIVYLNDLLFPLDQVTECLSYLDKKKFLIMKEVADNNPQKLEDMLWCFNAMVCDHARLHGDIIITKDDAVFRCSLPQKRGF